MKLSVRPFALAPDETVRFLTPWQEVRGSRVEALGEAIGDWDFRTVLRLKADLEIDIAALRRTTHQGSDAAFSVIVSAFSSTTRLRCPVWSSSIASRSRQRVPVDFELAGSQLGGRLDLITQVVLSQPDARDPLSARRPGSVVWRHRQSVLLEGDAEQFPTETADFSIPPFHEPHAGWFLEVAADDLDVSAASAVRLVLNESHPLVARILDGETSSDVVLALEVLRWDVARQLIDQALTNPEFVERDESFDEDSFGWLLRNVLATHFPGETPKSVMAMREGQPARYEATLQQSARIFG